MKTVLFICFLSCLRLPVAFGSPAGISTSEKDKWCTWKWTPIGVAIGMVSCVLIAIISVCLYMWICNKSGQPRNQDTEAGNRQRLLAPTSPATSGSENLNPQRETEQQNKDKMLISDPRDMKQELERQKDKEAELQKNLEQLQHSNKQLLESQNAVKHELENEKDQLAQKLQDVETKRKENEQELQSVEKKMTETSVEKDQLEEKERLLKSQWKLNEEKTFFERQILNIEKAMEPIEMQISIGSSSCRRNADVEKQKKRCLKQKKVMNKIKCGVTNQQASYAYSS